MLTLGERRRRRTKLTAATRSRYASGVLTPAPRAVLLVVAACFVVGASSTAAAAPTYSFHGVPWPGGVVRYYNAAPSQGWALWQAVAAWNRSGAKVRFVATSRRNAQLIIRHHRVVANCESARATVGFVRGATVNIYPRNDASEKCNRYNAARFLVHELGHVLGLLHEDGRCATMNSYGSYGGGAMCCPARPWEWRCRLLEPDDVRGVIAVYGGRPKPEKRPSPLCPLYQPIAPPTGVTATYVPDSGGVLLEFQPAADPVMPAFLRAIALDRTRGFAYLRQPNACPSPSMFQRAVEEIWTGRNATRFSSVVDQPPPGTYCYGVWSIDALGRPSTRVATTRVEVPEPVPVPPPPPPAPPPPPPPPPLAP
jgi:hypothetical protein